MQSIGWGASHDLYVFWMIFREGVTLLSFIIVGHVWHPRAATKRAILDRVKIVLKVLKLPKL